jgi:Na+:H+ antiporter, NhaA family
MGRWHIQEDVRAWINDALMAIFFFVVGLEIKREVISGDLRDRRAASLPVIAAVGGMAVPALIYFAINVGTAGERGWGIPMATDIAFAIGVLALAGRSLPSPLRSFLLALAIADDIGAIVVIAVFYSGEVTWSALGAAAGLLVLITLLRRLSVRALPLYVLLAAGVWLAVFESGVHAAIAGALLALVTPAVPFQRPRAVSLEAHRVADETVDDPPTPDADAHHWLRLSGLSREAVSPLARTESALHPWSSYVIVPVFALANAGVDLTGSDAGNALTGRVSIGVIAGLVVGKTIGITLAARAAVAAGMARLPRGVGWMHIAGVAAVAGIGFTVSIFVTSLAFSSSDLVQSAKLGILTASAAAGALGALLLRWAAKRGG